MTKQDLIDAIAQDANISKKAAGDALESFISSVTNSLKKGTAITLTGFGTFKTSERAARDGINPQTGAKIKIPARTAVTFKPGKALKESVN